jgi:hypothetical protein
VVLGVTLTLQQAGIPLFSEGLDTAGYLVRSFELHNDPIVNNLQVRREVCRHKILGLEEPEAIGCVQWLCSDESPSPFHWL